MAKILRMSVKIKNDGMQCRYCEHFRHNEEPEDSCFINRGKKRSFEANGSICEEFLLKSFFWCKKNGQQLDIVVCVARQKKGNEDCGRCDQGDRIFKYMEERKDENQPGKVTAAGK